MLFIVMGILKPDSEERLPGLQAAFNEHLAQPFRRIRLGGPLRGAGGDRIGYMVLMEAAAYAEAEAFLDQSPLFQADLYARVEVAQYDIEVGNLD
jgi:uncharacterized protein YciI